MKFDFAIGNPPYQDITTGENDTFAPPVYNKFLDSAYQIADKVEMIHPARFLSNAGSTPKEWNKKMLDDEHLKILYYEQDSSKVFSNTDIKGGVTVTYRDLTKNYDKVVAAIAEHEKTITLSVGQLTTGITIPEWTAVLMLSNMRSPALYMQAAFRAQNPCLFKVGTSFKRKENAYVFDFDPARTLTIFEQFANNLNPNTAKGGGTAEERKENVKELLNFFPVIGEDEQGELVELDAEKVLTIPRKIRSVEVVKRGFMSNFLFQNISNIFGAPKEVIDIITKFEPIEEPKSKVNLTEEVQKDLSLDENGEVALSDEFVIGRTQDVFGDKIYDVTSQVQETMTQMEQAPDRAQKAIEKLKEAVKQSAVKAVVDTAQSTYGSDMKTADKRQIESKLNHEADRMIDKLHTKNRSYKTITKKDILNHLQGNAYNASDVIGVYPLLSNGTCRFMVFDFDNHDKGAEEKDFANVDDTWIEEVEAMREICVLNGIEPLVERSRSGRGAHVWIFFDKPIAASLVRKFGFALLDKGAEQVNLKSFKYYDRMLPAQDSLPDNGSIGNLIALQLQGKALLDGNSAFVDGNWNAYPEQWEILFNKPRLSQEFLEEKIKEGFA